MSVFFPLQMSVFEFMFRFDAGPSDVDKMSSCTIEKGHVPELENILFLQAVH